MSFVRLVWDFDCLHFAQYISISPHGIDCKQTWCKKIYCMDRVSWLKPLLLLCYIDQINTLRGLYVMGERGGEGLQCWVSQYLHVRNMGVTRTHVYCTTNRRQESGISNIPKYQFYESIEILGIRSKCTNVGPQMSLLPSSITTDGNTLWRRQPKNEKVWRESELMSMVTDTYPSNIPFIKYRTIQDLFTFVI